MLIVFLIRFLRSECTDCEIGQICCDGKCLAANKSVFCCDSIICNTRCNGILNFQITDLNTRGFCLNKEDYSYYRNPFKLFNYVFRFTVPTLLSIIIWLFYGTHLSNKMVYIRSLIINISIGIIYFGYTRHDFFLLFIGVMAYLTVQGFYASITFGKNKNFFLQSELKLSNTLCHMQSMTYNEFSQLIENDYVKPPTSLSPYNTWKNARNKLSIIRNKFSVVIYTYTVTDVKLEKTETVKKQVFLIHDLKGKQILSSLDSPFWIASEIFGYNTLIDVYVYIRARVYRYENSHLISSDNNFLFRKDENDTSFNGTIQFLKQ